MARYIKSANLIPLNHCPMCGSSVFATYEERARYKYECDSCGQYFEFNAPSQLDADIIFNNIICGAKTDTENTIKLPCKIGDTIYVIPSKTNFKLNKMFECTKDNNRVYEQKVDAIHIYLTGYTLSCCEGLQHQPSALYGETWFITQEEAEAALKEREKE